MSEPTVTDLDTEVTTDETDDIEIVSVESSDVPAVMLCTYEF